MKDKNYKSELKKALTKLAKTKLLDNPKRELSEKENTQLLANKHTINLINKALTLIDKDHNKAIEILCALPHYMVSPAEGIDGRKYKIVGSEALYKHTDHIRHCIRMISLDSGGRVQSGGPIWNNIILI